MDQQQNVVAAKCTYCGNPTEAPVKAKIIDQAYDNVRRKKYVRTRELEFCSRACAGYYQMSCEG
ncbi:hypothetical protein VV867_08995 [Pseudomonas sp. JH-2]|uniref:hypothetical protein n=1 Tax=Pseudomonas sp. JH-2 TaxID=3114998 RepID=UPI002E26860D|nr:hypothetical protein [Pseudomonas sp. JH-2]